MKQKTINLVLTLMIVLVTILIAPIRLFLNEKYNVLKQWVMLVGGAILLILLLFNIKKFKTDKKDIMLFIFLILVAISTFVSSNLNKSIWGEPNRFEGMLMFFSYALVYLTAKKFYNYENKKELLNLLFYTFMIIGIIGIIQYYVKNSTINIFGKEYDLKMWYPFVNKGVNGTFGNSNFFGSFITIVLPISSYIFLVKGSKKAFLLSLVMFFNLINCLTRSAWGAFIVGAIFFVIFLIVQKNKTYFKRTVVLLIGFIIIGTYLFGGFKLIKTKIDDYMAQKNTETQDTNKKKKKVYTEMDYKIGAIKREINTAKETGNINRIGSGRIEIWKMTLKLIKQKPIFGCGTDNLREGLRKYCTQDVVNYFNTRQVEIDKAHNEYLHIGATIGIPALIVYLSFLATIVFPKMKTMFKNKTVFIITVTIICYLAQAFFNISTIGVAPLFWLLLGLIDNKEMIEDLGNI